MWLLLLLGVILALPAAASASQRDSRDRPTIDGTVLVHDSADGHFRIWYALDGGDALTALAGDEDPVNGVPDAVDVVEQGLGDCWAFFIDEQGWRPPGDDEGEGGDSRLDVYMRHIDHNGLATHEWHGDHWASYLQIEPDVAEMTADLLASVAAHELHHAIQYSYTVDAHTWVHEASACYAQYLLYADSVALIAAAQLLWGIRIEDPGVGLDRVGDRMEYSAMFWVKFLVDRSGGDLTVFHDWWEILAESPEWQESLERLAQDASSEDLGALLAEYGEWIYFACTRDDGQHWAADGLECLLEIESGLDHESDGLPAAWNVDPIPPPTGVSLATVVLDPPVEALRVSCNGPSDGTWSVRGVAIEDGDAATAATAGAHDGEAHLRLDGIDRADLLLVVVAPAGTGQAAAPIVCEAAAEILEDELEDEAAEGDSTAGACSCSATGRTAPATGASIAAGWAWMMFRRRRP